MQILTHLVPSLVLSGFFVAKHTTKGPVDTLKRSVFLHPANCILRKRNVCSLLGFVHQKGENATSVLSSSITLLFDYYISEKSIISLQQQLL